MHVQAYTRTSVKKHGNRQCCRLLSRLAPIMLLKLSYLFGTVLQNSMHIPTLVVQGHALRDQSILVFSPIFLSSNSLFQCIMLYILIQVNYCDQDFAQNSATLINSDIMHNIILYADASI